MENNVLKAFYNLNEQIKKQRVGKDINTLYGNITYEGGQALLEYFKEYFNEDTVFYDLGCGPGHLPVHVSVETNAKKCVGIELLKDRYHIGVKHYHTILDNRAQLINGDMFMHDWSDATIIYIDNTVMTFDLMEKFWNKVPKGCLVIMCKPYKPANTKYCMDIKRSYVNSKGYYAIK